MARPKGTKLASIKEAAIVPFKPQTNAEIILQDVIQPIKYKGSEGDGWNRRPEYVITTRREIDGKAYKPAPPRTVMPAWQNTDNLYISPKALSPVFNLLDAKSKPKVKTGPSGALVLVEANADWSGNYYAHFGPVRPEYDLLEAFTLYDVEVYVQQAIRRRLSLMFRNGYRVTGSNQNKVDYINRRLNQMAYMMKKTWANFMREILNILSLCSNCFLLKIRSDDASGGVSSDKNNNRTPVAAYVIIPPHSLFPYVDKGKITKWRRYYNWSIKPWEDYAPQDIIHLTWDRKPSHIFGTPRLQAVRDDIFAIRRLEENIELLFINYLFPLFHVKVGSKEAPVGFGPGGVSELDHTRRLLETMPKEGVLVTDERVAIETVGAEGTSLDPGPILEHYKKRIFTGLGVSPLDMGESQSANASTADSVSQALKDSIKYDLDVFADQVSMEIFRDLFSEANFALSIQESIADVKLEFQEIDMDNKVKEENHATNLYNNNGITHDEFRQKIKHNPMSEEQKADTHHEREVVGLAKTQANLAIKVAKATPKVAAKPGGKKGKSGRKASVTKKATPKKKVTQNLSTPTNQHGTNNSPKKAKSSKFSENLYLRLQDNLESTQLSDELENWPAIAARTVDRFFAKVLNPDGSSYTNYHRMQIDHLKTQVGHTMDLDDLFDLVERDTPEDPIAHGDSDEPATGSESNQVEPSPEGSAV